MTNEGINILLGAMDALMEAAKDPEITEDEARQLEAVQDELYEFEKNCCFTYWNKHDKEEQK